MIRYKKNCLGFTLIEMIVSLGVFSVVVTTAVGAFLVLIATNQQLQSEQSVMTNLAFALDTMTREIRTGYNYYCAGRPNYNSGGAEAIFDISDSQEAVGAGTNSCPNGMRNNDNLHGVSFYEGGNSITGVGQRRILYFYDKVDKKIMRRVGDEVAQPIVSSGIDIVDANFFVTGSETQLSNPTEYRQPTVTIYIDAIEANGNSATDKHYRLQTTVTQRTLDL